MCWLIMYKRLSSWHECKRNVNCFPGLTFLQILIRSVKIMDLVSEMSCRLEESAFLSIGFTTLPLPLPLMELLPGGIVLGPGFGSSSVSGSVTGVV